jgi:hypothetical protein
MMFAAPAMMVSFETKVRSSVFIAWYTPTRTIAPRRDAVILELFCMETSVRTDFERIPCSMAA